MRIALLTDGLTPYVTGGMQRHSFNLCKYFAGAGVHVDLYHCDPENKGANRLDCFTEDERLFITNEVVEFPSFGKMPGHYLRESYEYSRRIYARLIGKAATDFIYVKGFAGWELLNQKAKGKTFPPIGVNFHGYEMFQKQPDWKSALSARLFLRSPVLFNIQHADYLFSYGGKVTSIITSLGVERKKIIEIPGGIDKSWVTDKVEPVHEPICFLFVGRYERRKGVEELLAALKKLQNTSRDKFTFEFVGPIPTSKQLKGFQYSGELSNKEELIAAYLRSDVLVVPSHSEGMPNVILEAMASGLAIAATDVGAVTALVNGENGWIIPGTAPDDIHHVLRNIINCSKHEIAERKMNSVRKVSSQFTWEKIGTETLDFVTTICK